MRRFDKKQNILEANLRVLGITEESEFEKLVEDVKKDVMSKLNELNEGFMLAAGSFLALGKLMDILGSGLKKLTFWLVKKGIISKDGKTFNNSQKVGTWLKEKGEWWSEKIMSFFTWAAGIGIKAASVWGGYTVDESVMPELKKKVGAILFYLTITYVGFTALTHLGHLSGIIKGIESLTTSVKGYEIVIVISSLYFMYKYNELKDYSFKDVAHALESCVEDSKKDKEQSRIECVTEKLNSHSGH